MSTLKYN